MKQRDKSLKRYWTPIPKHYSPEMSDLIEYLLYPLSSSRPSIDDVLNSKIIRKKVKELFPEEERPKSKGGVDVEDVVKDKVKSSIKSRNQQPSLKQNATQPGNQSMFD